MFIEKMYSVVPSVTTVNTIHGEAVADVESADIFIFLITTVLLKQFL